LLLCNSTTTFYHKKVRSCIDITTSGRRILADYGV
jgi:hypothetical protein